MKLMMNKISIALFLKKGYFQGELLNKIILNAVN